MVRGVLLVMQKCAESRVAMSPCQGLSGVLNVKEHAELETQQASWTSKHASVIESKLGLRLRNFLRLLRLIIH